MQVKTVVIILAGVVTLLLGVSALALALGPMATAVALAALLLVAQWIARQVVLGIAHRGTILWGLAAAGVVHAGWVVGWAARPDLGGWFAGGLLLLGWAEYLLASGTRYLLTRRATPVQGQPQPQLQVRETPARPAPRGAADTFEQALTLSDYGYLIVIGSRAAGRHCVVFHMRVPAKVTALLALEAKGDSRRRTLAPFGRDSAEAIAVALTEITGVRLRRNWVEVEQTEYAGEYTVAVMTKDVMAEVRPYVDDATPASINDPAPIGVHVDGTRATLDLRGHGQVIAQSGAGKTSFINLVVAYLTRCVDAVPWLCGRRKQYESWGAWLESYMGTDHDLPIDWIANGQEDTVNMLLAAWLIVQWRQAVPFDEREAWPAVVILLDEATDVLADTTVSVTYGGERFTASKLLEMLGRGAMSAGVYIVPITHRGTNAMFGDQGGNTKSSFAWSAALRSNDEADLGRVIGDHKLQPLEHQGELYLKQRSQAPRRTKGDYMQEIGKPNAPQTGGITVPEVGWSRRHMVTHLDAGSQRAAGSIYAARHRRMTPAMRDYLRHGAPQQPAVDPGAKSLTTVSAEGQSAQLDQRAATSSRAAGYEAARQQIAAIEAAAAAAAVSTPVATVTVLDKPASRKDRIAAIVRAAGRISRAEIVERLRAEGDELGNGRVVDNALRELRDEGVLDRPETGVYVEA